MNKISLTLMLMTFFAEMYAQTDHSYFGSSLTPRGDLHILIVFVGFDTTTTADNYINWAHDDLPEWAKGNYNDVIDIDDSQIHTKRNITSYFSTMSNGDFIVTGEIYPEQIMVSPLYLSGSGDGGSLNTPQAVKDAVDVINLQGHATFDYDWSRFDERKNNPLYDFDNSLYSNTGGDPAVGDNNIDYIVFIIRDIGCSGVATTGIGTTRTLDNGGISWGLTTGHRLTQGCGTGGDARSMWHIFIHEMMHTIYSAPHNYHANNVVGKYFYGYQGWGFMANYDAMECANSWERWWLDYVRGWCPHQPL